MNILITGGNGNLAKELVSANKDLYIWNPTKADLNICDYKQVSDWISNLDIVIHSAALTRPMIKHVEDPIESINSNIIGTCNVVKACIKENIKLVYISTDYVYPGTDGNYKENDAILPVNEYAWSKLGGECAVTLHPNHLILRICMCEYPFPHPKAICDVYKSMIYQRDAALIIWKLIERNASGTINIGGEKITPYEFASKNFQVERISSNVSNVKMAKDSSMNIEKMRNLINEDS